MSNEISRWRLIFDNAQDGAGNMATDEALLESVASGESLPVLRFYSWEPACLSIGYAQKTADFELDRLAADGYGFVRRPSGGRGVLHCDELTYCLCVPEGDWRVSGGVVASYRRLSDGFLAGLASLGAAMSIMAHQGQERATSAACFDAPGKYELTAGGRKLIGSAQWRRNGGVLQHGSIPLYGDVAGVTKYLAISDAEREQARQLLRKHAIAIDEALGRTIDSDVVAQALANGLGEKLSIEWQIDDLTNDECERAAQLRQEKYGTVDWNFRH